MVSGVAAGGGSPFGALYCGSGSLFGAVLLKGQVIHRELCRSWEWYYIPLPALCLPSAYGTGNPGRKPL